MVTCGHPGSQTSRKLSSKYSFLPQGGRRHVFCLKSRARKVFCVLGGTLGWETCLILHILNAVKHHSPNSSSTNCNVIFQKCWQHKTLKVLSTRGEPEGLPRDFGIPDTVQGCQSLCCEMGEPRFGGGSPEPHVRSLGSVGDAPATRSAGSLHSPQPRRKPRAWVNNKLIRQ